nr:transposase [Macromonas bipunctata]
MEPARGGPAGAATLWYRDADTHGGRVSHALEQKPLDVQHWLQDIYPVIARRAKEESGIIYWADETAVVQDGHWVRGYVPAGQTPELVASSKRFRLAMVSAVSNQGLVRFEFLEGAPTPTAHWASRKSWWPTSAGHKVFLIMDNLRAHHAKDVTAWAQAHAGQIELFYLPPYTPQPNPDEYLNRDFKTESRSANRCSMASSLRAQAAAFMEFLATMPERVKSYFNHEPVVFAACSVL